jgi:4-carboxymuconolactone decarboxylase
LAVITVVAHWKTEYVWCHHSGFARDQGISDEAIEAIADGREPMLTTDQDRAAYAVARELVTIGTPTDETLDTCRQIFGEQATVELVTTCGYYSMLSFLVNVVAIPLPVDVAPRWPAVQGAA